MKIIPIFDGRLYSFHYETYQNEHELDRIFDNWNDPEYLEDFFESRKNALNSAYFGVISVEEAVLHTIAEAADLESILTQLATSDQPSLDDIFNSLHKGYEIGPFVPSKAYGQSRKRWLRIYALRLEPGVYAITGGAIKLTRTMQEGEDTREELRKIERCRAWLNSQGIDNMEGFVELVSE